METVVGPVELVVLAFPGSRFNGQIIPSIADLVNRGVVAILDFAVVTKDQDGNMVAIELADLEEETRSVFDQLEGEVSGLLSEDDLAVAAEALEPGSTAAVIVWENTWARRLVGAIQGSGGFLVAHERLDAASVAAALDTLALDNEQER